MTNYLIYVTKFSLFAEDHREFVVYEYCGDVFHAMGEILYRTFEQIYYINYLEDNEYVREDLAEHNIKINKFVDKYPYKEE